MFSFNKKDDSNSEKQSNQNKALTGNDPLTLFLGIILLGVGLFMLSRRVMVHSSWYIWRIGSFDLSSGAVTIPLIIGFIWYFFNPKSIIPKMIIILGALFIIVTVILSIRINFVQTSMFDYILIFLLSGAGAGLLLRTVFSKKE